MSLFVDARLPLRFGAESDAGPEDALLLEGEGAAARGLAWFRPPAERPHPIDCSCCVARTEAGRALSGLLLARGRGDGLFFRRVVAVIETAAGRQAVLQALAADPVVSVSFKLES